MMLLDPLALVLCLLSIPIILMYVLKLRRQQYVVSSTLLWRRALDDVQANAPWKRLRPGVLLLLQLLALLTIVLALAGPAYTSSRQPVGDLVLVVDESYGMQAHDVSPSRFVAAQSQAHALVANLPDGHVASVIGMGVQPRLAIAQSNDAAAISGAIDALRPSVAGQSNAAAAPNFLGALSLAASLARGGGATRVVVLTSRESGISALTLRVPFPVEIVRLGARVLHDLGITAFSAEHNGTATRALARVGNFGGASAGSDLELYVDGQLADVRPVAVDQGKQETLFWTDLPRSAHILRVRLSHPDDVDADKEAWVVMGTPASSRALLVTGGDYFVQTALSLDSAVRLRTVAPNAYQLSVTRGYDLTVFDGVLPPILPETSILLLSPPAGRTLLPGGERISLGRFRPAAEISTSPRASGPLASILQFVSLSDVHVARLRESGLPSWITPIATAAGGRSLLAAGENNGVRVAVAAFNLRESDWPLQIGFPILIKNLLHYLAPTFGPESTTIAAGDTVRLHLPEGTSEIRVTRPDGGVDTLRPPPGAGGLGFVPFADTSLAGVYTAAVTGGSGSRTATFAVNFFPVRPAPASGSRVLHLGAAGSKSTGGSAALGGIPVGVGWAFALGGLILLSAEWWFAFRR